MSIFVNINFISIFFMIEWFSNLSETVKAATIGATIGAIVALLSILFKDWIFQLLSENRKSKKDRNDTFKKYANPIILSSVSLAFRIKEIFENRGYFLLDSAPKNTFNKYKYISTLYRICSLLGWIRASKKEISFIEVKQKKFKTIEKVLQEFENSLADGTHVETSRVEHLCREWNLNYDNLNLETKKKLGIEIEHIFRQFIFEKNVQLPTELDDKEQVKLLKTIADFICKVTKNENLDIELIREKQKTAIKEISRIENWVYRDWQLAIGDMMIVDGENTSRKYDIIGYGEFEYLYETAPELQKRWIERIDNMFRNLNVFIDDRFDARTLQLKNVYVSVLDIIEAHVSIQSYTCISKDTLNVLRKYKDKLGV